MKTLGGIIFLAGTMAFLAWALMIIVGIIHADWIPFLPTISFWTALLITSILSMRSFVISLVAETFKAVRKVTDLE